MSTLKIVKITILTTAITLLILAYPTYRVMEGCHPDCTPEFTHPLMESLEYDQTDPQRHRWESPMEKDYGPFFGQPTLTPRPSTSP